MALNATIFKADLQIADMDRHYYESHGLTIARHPSETDERMMVRLLAFARHANQSLVFAKGMSDTEEPDLWQKDLTGAIELWIEVGQPEERRLLKAAGRAEQVVLYTYGGHGAHIWWNQIAPKLTRLNNLTVFNIAPETTQALAAMTQRTMQLQCNVQDGDMWLGGNEGMVQVELSTLQSPRSFR